MRSLKERSCTICNNIYLPTGSCSKYCPICRAVATKKVAKAAIHNWAVKTGYFKGTGSGSNTGSGEDNHMFIHGQGTFRHWAKELKESDKGFCEHCNKDLRPLTHYEWVGHHKDHNRMHNTKDNLALLCKRCHQVEHQCWNAFEGVTTSRKT